MDDFLRRFGRSFVLASFVGLLSGCASTLAPASQSSGSSLPPAGAWPQAYKDAINDALDPEPNEVVTNLVAIVRSNPTLVWKDFDDGARVLMVSLVSDPSFYRDKIGGPYETGNRDTWVTAVPELRRACAQPDFSRGDLAMRLRQLLGLTPTAPVTAFVEFWVAPARLFRPAPDNEITDTTAGLNFPANTERWYREWFNRLRARQYFDSETPLNRPYPWTQLGYTYDWGSPTLHQGMSEFVVKTQSTLIVNTITSVDDYCRAGRAG